MQASLSLWQPFGLRGSPFFQEELKPTATGEPPISLFVGRAMEVDRLLRRLASDSSSRTIVEGAAGIGKTSFANRLKAAVAPLGISSHEHPIRITSDMGWAAFVRETLRAILRVRLGLGLDNTGDEFWRRTVFLLEGGELRGAGAGAFGFSGSVSRSMVGPQVPLDSLYEHLGKALSRLREETERGVLLHVNNLENQALENADRFAVLLRDLRDHFLLPGAHWVFVGIPGVEEKIFRLYDQVGGIFPGAEVLAPLTPAEVSLLLRERYRHLALPGASLTEPIEAEAAERLYGLYQGDLRNFLRLLGEAAERALGVSGVRPMRINDVLGHMAPDYARRLRDRMTDTDFQYLSTVVREAGSPSAFRVTDVQRFTRLSQGAASKLVERFRAARVIQEVRSDGRSIFYSPVGSVLVAFGAGLPASAG